MLKFRKKFLAVLLTAAMVLSTSQLIVWSDEEPTEEPAQTEITESTGSSDSDEGSTEGGKLLTDAEGLAQMKKIADNSKFTLYLNEETTAFAVQSKADSYVWWSSPLNAQNDPKAKDAQKNNMYSPFFVDYGEIETNTPGMINAYDGSIKRKDFKISDIENGVRIDYNIEKINVVVPITISLGEDFVNVKILSTEITERDAGQTTGNVILDIALLQFFGAGSTSEDGYMVLPDGSGALINFNNHKETARAYSAKVYGADSSVGLLLRPAKTEQVYLPVIGNIIKGETVNHGFLGVVDKGDTCAEVNATVSGNGQSNTSYNNTWFEFQMRTDDVYYMGKKKLTVYEAGEIHQPDISVNYYPIAEKDASYVTLAQRYRKYLEDEKGLKAKNDADIKNSYFLNIYGGTVTTQSIVGFPVDLETPATTFSQAQTIMSKLDELGVKNIIASYNNFDAAGVNGMISTGADYSGTLGGKNGFDSLKSYADSVSAKIYPILGITFMKKSGNGYSYSLNACRRATKAYATVNNWDIAFGIPNQVKLVTKTTLSPYYWTDLFDKITNSFNRENLDTICIGNATTLLYSDFSRGIYTRNSSKDEIVKGLEKLKAANLSILAEGANAYAIPYVDYITNVPLSSSNFDLFDVDIPFYELVIHGVVPYTTKAINASAEASQTIMLALSTATPVHYDMMFEAPSKFTDSDYDTLFYSQYEGWLKSSASIYKLMEEKLAEVINQKIVSHKITDGEEIETVYENGTTVIVNLRKNTMSINGTSVDLTQYGLKGEVTSE